MSNRTLAATQRTRAVSQHMSASTQAKPNTSQGSADEVSYRTVCRWQNIGTDMFVLATGSV